MEDTTLYVEEVKNGLEVKITADDPDFIPVYKTEGAACLDCKADVVSTLAGRAYDSTDTITLEPGQIEVISLGFRVAVPPGYVMNVNIRSGLAANYGVTLINGTGKIDSDYRGIVKAIVGNISTKAVDIKHKDRIAQCEIVPVHSIHFTQVDVLDETERGEGGLGSTGVNG